MLENTISIAIYIIFTVPQIYHSPHPVAHSNTSVRIIISCYLLSYHISASPSSDNDSNECD